MWECGPGAGVGAAVGAVEGGGAADVCCAVADGADLLGGGDLGMPTQLITTSGSRQIAMRLVASACMSMTPPQCWFARFGIKPRSLRTWVWFRAMPVSLTMIAVIANRQA
jgi:hypothetical protein